MSVLAALLYFSTIHVISCILCCVACSQLDLTKLSKLSIRPGTWFSICHSMLKMNNPKGKADVTLCCFSIKLLEIHNEW